MSFKDRLKDLRVQKGLTQEELGQKVGLRKAAIYKYEKGLVVNLKRSTIEKLANVLDVPATYLMCMTDDVAITRPKGVKIPILGSVAAGVPITAISNIEDYEEITPDMAKLGKHFALRVKGASMSPRIDNNDIVIVRQQAFVNNGDVAVVLVNGDEATVKEIKKLPDGLMLIGWNTSVYPPKVYSKEDVEKLPISIIGKVVELRRKF